jgi:protein involved in polysaccharide export with SLBB domain
MSLVKALALGAAILVQAIVGSPAHAQAAKSESSAARHVPDYKLGSGDKLRISTFGEESLTGEFVVSGTGQVSIPLLGEISAVGLTAREFQARMEAALRQGDFLKDPRVTVEVLTYRPFYILGEVNKPGEYPYTNGLTVLNAVATAEGFTYRANKKKVMIKRAADEKEEDFELTGTTPVAPGDTIRIPERFF